MEHAKSLAAKLSLLFREASRDNPDPLAVRWEGGSASRGELWLQSGRVAKALIDRGLMPGDRIASWSPNVVESIILQCAALRIGVVTVYLDPEWDADQLCSAVRCTGVTHLFSRAFHEGRQYPAMIKSVRGHMPQLRGAYVHGRQPRFERLLPGGWTELLEVGDSVPDRALAEREDHVTGRGGLTSSIIMFSDDGQLQPLALNEQRVIDTAAKIGAGAPLVCAGVSFHRPAGLVLGCLVPLLGSRIIALPKPNGDAPSMVRLLRDAPSTNLVVSRAGAAALGHYIAAGSESRIRIERCWIADGSAEPLTAASTLGSTVEIVDEAAWFAGDASGGSPMGGEDRAHRPAGKESEGYNNAGNPIL